MSQSTLGRDVAAVVITDLASTSRHAKNLVANSNLSITSSESEDDGSISLSEKPKRKIDSDELKQTQSLQNKSRHAVQINLASGAMAGAVAKTFIAPFDRTKIYFQATKLRYSYSRAFNFLLDSYRKHGFFSLWRGNTATMARIIPYAAIQFTSHEEYKKILKIDQSNNKPMVPFLRFLAGSMAGVTSQALTYPLDMARARMAVTPKDMYSSFVQVFVKIWKTEGPLTLYRGLTPTLLGVIPYAGTSFGIYETLKHYHKEKTSREAPNPLERAAFGAISGAIGQTCSYPLDIVRRRMQTASVTGNGGSYKTIIGTIVKVYSDEGLIRGLYKGLSLNWVKGPIAGGISFAIFDSTKQTLEEMLQSR